MSVTIIIAIITSLVSVIAFKNPDIKDKLSFNAYKISHNKEIHRIFTHALIHADWMHLIINILVFVSFGNVVEQYFQIFFPDKYLLYYLTLYIGGVIFSSLYGLMKHKDDYYYNAVGASGAVSAILFASILIDPLHSIHFYMIIPIPGIIFGVLYLFYSYRMNKRGNDNIAHDAHLFGAIFGMIYPVMIMPSLFIHFIKEILSVFG